MHSEDASILLRDNLLVDDFKVVKVLDGLQEFIDEVDAELAASKGKLDNAQCHQCDEEVKVEGEDSVG
jgi:hypothetical protein